MDLFSRPLPSGDALPSIGFGTWDIPEREILQNIEAALDKGYRHIDTAEGYKNEAGIGEAIASFDRADLFLTSKVLPKHLAYESVIEACHGSLERLGTDYLDLYLIHWPNPAISLRETLAAMAHLHAEGLVRNIGVSNFSAYQLSCAHRVTDVPIAVNQIKYHPWWRQNAVVEYCAETDTVVEAAAPLARGGGLRGADDHRGRRADRAQRRLRRPRLGARERRRGAAEVDRPRAHRGEPPRALDAAVPRGSRCGEGNRASRAGVRPYSACVDRRRLRHLPMSGGCGCSHQHRRVEAVA
jgi:diketogulonate reductase-like aldo/keto reductase